MRYLMGIDNGGTFSKAAIFDENGKQISVASVPTVTITPKPGYTERDMEELWQVNAKAVREAIEKSKIDPKDIAGVSFSGHGKGVYLVGKDGKPSYHGIISTDARAWSYVKKWKEDGTAEKVYAKTYQDILACQPVSLLAWLKDHCPEVLENTKYVFAIVRFLFSIYYCDAVKVLTGKRFAAKINLIFYSGGKNAQIFGENSLGRRLVDFRDTRLLSDLRSMGRAVRVRADKRSDGADSHHIRFLVAGTYIYCGYNMRRGVCGRADYVYKEKVIEEGGKES